MKISYNTFENSQKRGLTLVEMLVALVIFSISFVALMTVTARGVASTASIESELVTQYLALESIELVRNMRDSNYIFNVKNAGVDAKDWLDGIGNCKVTTESDLGCYAKNPLDSSGERFVECDASSCPAVEYATGSNIYFQSTETSPASTITPYTRSIQMYQKSGDLGYNIRVNVSWTDRARTQSRTGGAYITDWQQSLMTP